MREFLPRRELGRTGFVATLLGIGDLADRTISVDQCVATVHRAMDAGLNVIDTAPAYEDGYSEKIVGEALKGRRDSMFVIDKIDFHDRPVAPQVEMSLRRLQLEATDLFVFHAVSTMKEWKRITRAHGGMEQLEKCRQEGKCRFRGISSHHPEVLRAAIASGMCDVLLFPIGPACDIRYSREILPLARKQGIGTVCFKTFGAGKLLGDTMGYNQPMKERPRGKLGSGGEVLPAEPSLPHLGVRECVHYTLTCDPDVALLGLSYPNEQDAAFEAARDFAPLSPLEMEDIENRGREAVEGKGHCWWNPEEQPAEISV